MTEHHARIAAAFRATLPAHAEVTVFRIDRLDRIGIPVVQANLLLPGRPATIAYGYGMTAVEAEVGANGELCEEVHAGIAVAAAPGILASTAELIAARGRDAVADPLTLCLPAGSPYTPDMKLDWIAAHRWPDGAEVMVPREWVAAYDYQLPSPPSLITPITNGLGAGFDLHHALAHGVMELLQRDGNAVSYRALDQGVVVEPDAVGEENTALIARLRALGIDVTIKLAATDFGMADLYVVGDDPAAPTAPIQISACGEACHPDAVRGLRKALLEFVGARSRKAATHGPMAEARQVMPTDYVERQIAIALLGEESRAAEAMAEWVGQDAATLRARLADTVFAERRRVAFSSLPTVAARAVESSADRLALLSDRLAAEGLSILWVDCSPPASGSGEDTGDVRVVRVIVPGLECETMSYHRLGWRGVRRLRQRGDRLVGDGPRDGAARVRLRPEDEAKCGGPAWLDTDEAERLLGALYPMYREPGPFAAQLLREGKGQGLRPWTPSRASVLRTTEAGPPDLH